jgi:hypothetical protein
VSNIRQQWEELKADLMQLQVAFAASRKECEELRSALGLARWLTTAMFDDETYRSSRKMVLAEIDAALAGKPEPPRYGNTKQSEGGRVEAVPVDRLHGTDIPCGMISQLNLTWENGLYMTIEATRDGQARVALCGGDGEDPEGIAPTVKGALTALLAKIGGPK